MEEHLRQNLKQNVKKATYLVCVSDTDYSKIALDFANKLAGRKNGKIIALHITEPVNYQSFGAIANKMQEEQTKEAEKLLEELTKEIDVEFICMHKEGFIGEEIIKIVEEHHDIDMLILGSAAESSARSKTLQPIVAQLGVKIMVPVLIIPGNLTQQQMDLLA